MRIGHYTRLDKAPFEVFQLVARGFSEIAQEGHCRRQVFIDESQGVIIARMHKPFNNLMGVLLYTRCPGNYVYVNMVFVDEAWRKCGALSGMLSHLEAKVVKGKGCVELDVHGANLRMCSAMRTLRPQAKCRKNGRMRNYIWGMK